MTQWNDKMSDTNLTLLILEQSAHCDWDWLQTFDQYYENCYGNGHAVKTILETAIDYVTNTPGYTYVFCEVGYLKKYFDSKPSDLQQWRDAIAAGTFQFSSGGVTSAENLTLHTEAFVRNYLFGRRWLKTHLDATASLRMWVPDDFGHDAQLPVLLKALGYTGVGFWRIPVAGPNQPPGAVQINGSNYTVSAAASAPSAFLTGSGGGSAIGVDFLWQAADGSTVQAHWLMNGYGEGNKDLGIDPSSPDVSGLASTSSSYQALSPSGIAFVPVDNDFSLPYQGLPTALAKFSDNGVTAQLGTFDDFLTQANSGLQTVSSNPPDGSHAFVPHPYYSGCYATHPQLKHLHYATVRTLLMTETAALILEILGSSGSAAARSAIADAWWATLPSTHHDYITGTAPTSNPENVYEGQVLRLKHALALATTAQKNVISAISAAIDASGASIDGTPFAAFNPIAYTSVDAIVQVACDDPSQYASSTSDGTTFYPVQTTTDGSGLLAVASQLPSMGYQTLWLSTSDPLTSFTLSVTDNGDGSFTLANASLSATVTTSGITAMYDLLGGPGNLFPNADGNTLVYYEDTGSIYRFANEVPWSGGTDGKNSTMRYKPVAFESDLSISITENGPLRVTVEVTGSVTVSGEAAVKLTIAYSLIFNEPFLRIETTSAAPGTDSGSTGYSVMVSFPFAPNGDMSELAFGTTSHWDQRAPRPWLDWSPKAPTEEFDFITFEPAHEWVVAYNSSGNILGGIYHSSSPAWAISADQTAVLGCILRNTPNSAGNGAQGSDTWAHSISYAVRVPSGLAAPSSGASRSTPLVEALLLNNPPIVSAITQSSSAFLPAALSLAGTGDDNALVTVAKLGTMDDAQLILRVYQPSNGSTSTSVYIDTALAKSFSGVNASAVTALEDAPADNVTISETTDDTVAFTMTNAIATLAYNQQRVIFK